MNPTDRFMVIWIPDWPVHALVTEFNAHGPAASDTALKPRALIANHRVVACCASARASGVRTGMRERDAQSICPALELHPHDPDREARNFAPVVAALEAVVTGIETLRPGLAALRARGPARYYGGEQPAAHAVSERIAGLGYIGVRIGIADGAFAAEQAARSLTQQPRPHLALIPAGGSRAFLSPLPIARAAPARLATTLQGLGIHTLGTFAALPEDAVRQRFGGEGVACHQLALGISPAPDTELRPFTSARDFSCATEFEPALNSGALLGRASTALVSRLFESLTDAALICTGIRIELTDDIGTRHERVWSHPTRFSLADVIDRIHWQAESGMLGATNPADRGGAGIISLKITPTHTDRAAAHESGLWGGEPDDRVRHHLRGVQHSHGQDAIGTTSLRGGRLAAHRQQFTPWGLRPTDCGHNKHQRSSSTHAAGLPWPGTVVNPTPSLIFEPSLPATLTNAVGDPVGITPDDLLDASPAHFSVDLDGARDTPAASAAMLHRTTAITSWSSPWPLRERWWEGVPTRFRLQVVLGTGDAWLLFHETDRWYVEGKYD